MSIFNRKARFIERRKQQFALEPGERDRRKTPHIYPPVRAHNVYSDNTTVINNTTVVDSDPGILSTIVEAEIVESVLESGNNSCCDPAPDNSCSYDPPDTSCAPDSSSDPCGGGGESGGGGADSSW